jgi:hypothetical protein
LYEAGPNWTPFHCFFGEFFAIFCDWAQPAPRISKSEANITGLTNNLAENPTEEIKRSWPTEAIAHRSYPASTHPS